MIVQYKGYLCERVRGVKLGRRGQAKRHYGWVIRKGDTVVTTLVPNADGSVSQNGLRIYVDILKQGEPLHG